MGHTAKGRCQCYVVRRKLSIFKLNALHEPKLNISGRILATEKFMTYLVTYHTTCRFTIEEHPGHRCNSCSIDAYEDEEDGLFFKKRSSSARHPRGSLELHLKHKTYYYLLESDHIYCVMKSLHELEKESQMDTSTQKGSCLFEPSRRNLFAEIKESEQHLEKQLLQTAQKTQMVSVSAHKAHVVPEPGPATSSTPCEAIIIAQEDLDRQERHQRIENWLEKTTYIGQQLRDIDSDEGGSAYTDAIEQLMSDNDVLLMGITEEQLQEAAKNFKDFRYCHDRHPLA